MEKTIDTFEKGTPVPTRMGTFHVGDIIEARLYGRTETGGTEINTFEGEIVYYEEECRFLIKWEEGLTHSLAFAEKPIVIKKWNE